MGGTDCWRCWQQAARRAAAATNRAVLCCWHPGAVDEGEREQGIAHLVEHVTFLGSKKREGLLGTGARWAAGALACTAGGALVGLLQDACMLQLPVL